MTESLFSALRQRALYRAEVFDQRKGHAADAHLLRDLVAAADEARDLLREWLTGDPYSHQWVEFEERVEELLGERAV